MKPRIVVVGSANTDLVVRVPRLPLPGETVSEGRFFRALGGKGANQAVAAARLGAAVTFVGCVGDDDLGQQAIEGLAAEGVDTGHMRREPAAPSGVALVMVDAAGENCISVAPGANASLTPSDVEAARDAIEGADALLLQLETPLESVEHAARTAHAAGVPVILNPAPARQLPESLLALLDVLTPNETEARMIAGAGGEGMTPLEAAAEIRNRCGAAVVVTLGAEGALVLTERGEERVPGFPVNAVDSTAAGDAFSGALAVALASGADLRDAVRRGCAAGALAATVEGARPSLPGIDRLNDLLAG